MIKDIRDMVEDLTSNDIITVEKIEDKTNEVAKKVDAYLLNMISIEKDIKELEKQKSTVRDILLKAMEENDVKKLETPFITVTYIAPTVRNTVDGKLLKLHFAEVYERVVKTSKVKSSVKISVK